jgi:hypothetical protein
MYGSPTYDCQVFFICQADGRLDPMPCPQGTRFNNYLGVCDWPQKVNTERSIFRFEKKINHKISADISDLTCVGGRKLQSNLQ